VPFVRSRSRAGLLEDAFALDLAGMLFFAILRTLPSRQ
jgi:hypothetical protein